MRNLILATVALASLAAPLAAQAYPGEVRSDRRQVEQQREELRDAYRSGDPRAIDREHRDLQRAHQELNADVRDRGNDRRDWRNDRHDDRRDWGNDRRDGDYRRDSYRDERRTEWRAERRYDAGRFYYPRGYGYRAWTVGGFVPHAYWGERYWVGRPVAYGLPYAVGGTRWVRVGPDALLIRAYNGAVLRVVRGIFY